MENDIAAIAQTIPSLIQNDTLVDAIELDKLSECLKNVILNVDDSLYIFDRIKNKYNVYDRFKAIHHIYTDFGEPKVFDSKKFVTYIRAIGRCLHFDIFETIAGIIDSVFYYNYKLKDEINQIYRNMAAEQNPQPQPQQQPEPTPEPAPEPTPEPPQEINKNIEWLKQIPQSEENFQRIYEVLNRIAAEKDQAAMSFAVSQNYVYVTEKYRNMMTRAAADNNLYLIYYLVEAGVDVNLRDKHNFTALLTAASYHNLEAVNLLLNAPGIDVNARDNYNETALMIASRKGYHEVVKLLLGAPGIDVNARNNNESTALMWASYYGRNEVVELLVTAPEIDVNAQNKIDSSALILAALNGHYEIVKVLKDHGAF